MKGDYSMKTSQDLREQIPFLKKLVYLDSASVVPNPKPVIDAMMEYYQEFPLNYGVGEFYESKYTTSKVDEARAKLAGFINAKSSDEVIFTKNTTEAINLVARGIDWKTGDEIIITSVEHQSNIMPWLRAQKEKGAVVKIAWAEPTGLVDPVTVEKLITPRTKLVAVTHVSNIYGTIQPVKEIGRIAKNAGVLFMVDAAQSGGRVPIDVQSINCDFLTLCGRKSLMGPQGTGALYAKKDVLDTLKPLTVGSRAGHVKAENFYSLNPIPHRLESGVLNTSGVIGLAKAIDCLNEIGVPNILKYNQGLTKQMLDVLSNTKGIQVYGCKDIEHLAGVISWNVQGQDCAEVARKLDEAKKVAVASGAQGSLLAIRHLGIKGVVRTSVHYFSIPDDIRALEKGLHSII